MAKHVSIPEFKLGSTIMDSNDIIIERLEKNANYDHTEPHRHNYYEIFIFEKGGGSHMIDFEDWDIADKDVHVLYPGQVHCVQRDASSNGWVLKCTPEYFGPMGNTTFSTRGLLHNDFNLKRPTNQLNQESFHKIQAFVHSINQEKASKDWASQTVIRNYLNLLMLELSRANNTGSNEVKKVDSMASKFSSLLEHNFSKQHRVTFYCEALAVNDSKLGNILKEAYGHGTSDLIANRILLEAKRFLLHSDSSIKEIGFLIGFEDNAYFNRWFKKYATYTPGEFRIRAKEKYQT